mgnify:CR=1 FL=1
MMNDVAMAAMEMSSARLATQYAMSGASPCSTPGFSPEIWWWSTASPPPGTGKS